MEIWPGSPFPLGATWDGQGTNFSLFSENAERVELCLFEADGSETCVELTERTAYNWHCYLPGVHAGQRYGYRVHGAYDPASGQRFNPAKLVLDPYAKALHGSVDYSAANVFAFVPSDDADADLSPDDSDSAPAIPKGVVIDPRFDWEDDRPPNTPLADSVIYETHVKGFTMRHPGVPEELRGTYAGLGSDAAVRHLQDLGVTAVELLPVHASADEPFLVERGLTNYWGYSPIGLFAPHPAYASTPDAGHTVREFKEMVKALHRAGIEVILDVAYDHTGEGDHLGPTLSLRGIDNAAYYRLEPDAPRHYVNLSGVGNSLNGRHPTVFRMVMDSLRYWLIDCRVDGFRLAHSPVGSVDLLAAMQDPVVSQFKLIAEPWDEDSSGATGRGVRAIWTDRDRGYRDDVRDFWRGDATAATLAGRLVRPRAPTEAAAVTFVTAHDGFTLADLVAHESSWDHEVRRRQQRNLLATLLLSVGSTPMLLGGDEIGRTQQGDANAWCQDNELSWYDWTLDGGRAELLAFTQALIRLRREHAALRVAAPAEPMDGEEAGLPAVWWFRADGTRMRDGDWAAGPRRLGVFLNGRAAPRPASPATRLSDASLLILVNGEAEPATFRLPGWRFASEWSLLLSTAQTVPAPAPTFAARGELGVLDRSLVVLGEA